MGTRSWEEIKAKAAPETLAAAARKTGEMLIAFELNELRKARNLTQEELARRLGTRQANVSKLERRADVRVSTLREVIEAMGGEMRITAHFSDGDYLLAPRVAAGPGR
jgi:DNA-binding Xre family transcriptional regulator